MTEEVVGGIKKVTDERSLKLRNVMACISKEYLVSPTTGVQPIPYKSIVYKQYSGRVISSER